MSRQIRWLPALLVLGALSWVARSQAPPPTGAPDLSGYRTVERAITTRITPEAKPPGPVASFGVFLEAGSARTLVVAAVAPDSPAERAGVLKGDVVEEVDGNKPADQTALRELVLRRSPGDKVKLTVVRNKKPVELSVTLAPVSNPLPAPTPEHSRVVLGIRFTEASGGLRVAYAVEDMPAYAAGVRAGDVILKIDDTTITDAGTLTAYLNTKNVGESVTLVWKHGTDQKEGKGKLASSGDRSWRKLWQKAAYRLAVIPIDFTDVKHNEKITPAEWEKAFFSRGTYTDKNVLGQKVYGSVNDYYREVSCGTFQVEGKVFGFVELPKKRSEYVEAANRYDVLTQALDALLTREGKDLLKGFDGLFFIYAGERVANIRHGSMFWAHRDQFAYKGKVLDYVIAPEGGKIMYSVSTPCHEFGHMLGLPDLYATPGNPNAVGNGVWCLMSQGNIFTGRPLHLSAWCKEQLGWLRPAVLDPTVRQKLILSPVEGSPTECCKVLVRPDGSEYFLLENRTKKGFDFHLPAEGLLIWRVVDGKPTLVESHGIAEPGGSAIFLPSIPYPSKANTAFTPLTMPSSKSPKGGGLPVSITNIQKLPDGRITFWIGYEEI